MIGDVGRKLFYATANLELGRFTLAATERGLCALRLPGPGEGVFLRKLVETLAADPENAPQRMSHAIAQLEEFLSGTRREFELDVDPVGSEFQLRVWRELAAIPFGETRTYGEIAAALGSPGAARAVGLACGKNPVAIVIPCHRVVASGGRIGGYGGGVEWKRRLLALEAGKAKRGAARPLLSTAS
jgi:O-6-methylguanine DNA methyltransferase